MGIKDDPEFLAAQFTGNHMKPHLIILSVNAVINPRIRYPFTGKTQVLGIIGKKVENLLFTDIQFITRRSKFNNSARTWQQPDDFQLFSIVARIFELQFQELDPGETFELNLETPGIIIKNQGINQIIIPGGDKAEILNRSVSLGKEGNFCHLILLVVYKILLHSISDIHGIPGIAEDQCIRADLNNSERAFAGRLGRQYRAQQG